MFTETHWYSNHYWYDSTYNIEDKNEKLSGTLETI